MFVYQQQTANQKDSVSQQEVSIKVGEGFIKPSLSGGNKISNRFKQICAINLQAC